MKYLLLMRYFEFVSMPCSSSNETVAFHRYYLLFFILLCFVLIIDDLTG